MTPNHVLCGHGNEEGAAAQATDPAKRQSVRGSGPYWAHTARIGQKAPMLGPYPGSSQLYPQEQELPHLDKQRGHFSSRPYFVFVLVMPSDLRDYSGGLQGPYGMGGIKPWLATREANALQAVPSPKPSPHFSDWPVLKPEAPCPTQVQKWWAEMSLLR